MAGLEAPPDGTSSALMSSLFGNVDGDRTQEGSVFAEGSLLQHMGMQVPGLFDVLQGQESQAQQPQQQQQQQQSQQGGREQGEANNGAGNIQMFFEAFMRSGSLTEGLVEQPAPQQQPQQQQQQQQVLALPSNHHQQQAGMLNQGLQQLQQEQQQAQQAAPRQPGMGSKELMDILSAQMNATASSGRDVSLEELIASGHVSAETLLSLIESLKAILPADPSQAGNMPSQNLAALAEILGLNQGESNVPVNQGQAAQGAPVGGMVPEGVPGSLQQQLQQQQSLAMHQGAGPGTGLNMGANYGSVPANRSNLGLSSSGAYGTTTSGGGSSLGLNLQGVNPSPRQQSSLRTRRGLPDLPVHRPSVGRAGSHPLSPLSGSATPSPKTGKRLANGLAGGPGALGWPLSPANKSPRADGQMSPAGSQLGPTHGPLAIANGPKFPASPTTALVGDLAKLAVHRPQTPPSGNITPPGEPAAGVKMEPSFLGQSALVGEGEGKGGDIGGEGGVHEAYEVGDEFADGDLGSTGDERHGDGGGDGAGSGNGGSSGRPKHSTKPRSVAERLRRERIAVRLQRLKEVMPKTDARIDTSAMLEDAVVYIRSLQSRCRALEKQNELLTAQVARLTQQQQQQQQHQNGPLCQLSSIIRPMGP